MQLFILSFTADSFFIFSAFHLSVSKLNRNAATRLQPGHALVLGTVKNLAITDDMSVISESA